MPIRNFGEGVTHSNCEPITVLRAPRDRPDRLARHQAAGDPFPLGQRQPQRRPDRPFLRRPVQSGHRPPDGIPRPVNLLIQFPDRRALCQQLRDPLPFRIRNRVQYAHLPTKIQLGQDEAVALTP